MSGDDAWDENDRIGYGRPPTWSRFAKGRSGNPKGRPPRKKVAVTDMPAPSSQQDEILRAELSRSIQVTERGKTVDMPVEVVIIRAQLSKAAKGDVIAQRDVLAQARDLERREQLRAESVRLEAEQQREEDAALFKYIKSRRDQQTERWSTGEPASDICWPHPDDFLIDEVQRTWRIRGPFDPSEVLYYQYVRRHRDAELLKAMILARSRPRKELLLRAAVASAMDYEALLPKRWHVMDDLGMMGWFLDQFTLRELRKMAIEAAVQCEKARIAAGVTVNEQAVYPIVNQIVKPLLGLYGYRSLAEFESAWEQHGENMPWERRPRGTPLPRGRPRTRQQKQKKLSA